MQIRVTTIVLDAADLFAESAFWSQLLGGTVHAEDGWHTIRVDGSPRIAIQGVPDHTPPDWPDGSPQQIHLDLDVDDIRAAHPQAVALGAQVLSPAAGPDLDASVGFQVYADPAGHPFCLCWGQP
ncbi:VOC family protein [Luteipulveratus mongoliensis]|uniref:Glyoxalase n=1 Tax=Luteipulveratus mongoliensis TaxID=571913 RepID=A0A0K1JEY8_9MICO|nr:VOC family protein [Luteipulveratus mongoliensis]AKU15261.1 glyoxalase [Luteipulveratus mongoliensis]